MKKKIRIEGVYIDQKYIKYLVDMELFRLF